MGEARASRTPSRASSEYSSERSASLSSSSPDAEVGREVCSKCSKCIASPAVNLNPQGPEHGIGRRRGARAAVIRCITMRSRYAASISPCSASSFASQSEATVVA